MTGHKQPYYITTPIYYVNDKPHIGHAYTTLACDVLARFKRLDGYDVMFLTGTDEHGQKVDKSAAAKGIDPQSFTDQVSQNFRDLARVMNFSNDDFIRTTEERHIRSSQAIWRRLVDNGEIYLDSYAGWYAVRDEAFYTGDELIMDADGNKVAPSGAGVEWGEEPSYFFRLSAGQDRLLEFYDANPDFILPKTRRNEVVSFVSGGLKDLSVSRTTFKWGVPVPGDEDHIMYVWLDALTNYITGVGFPETDSGEYATFWPADLHQFAVFQDRNPIPDLQCLIQIVGDKHDGLVKLRLKLHQLILHVRPDQWIKGGESLVHQQNFRIGRKGPGKTNALLHATG